MAAPSMEAPSQPTAAVLSRCLYLYRGRGTPGNSCGEMAGGTKFSKCMQQPQHLAAAAELALSSLGSCLAWKSRASREYRVLLSNSNVCGHKIVIAGRRGPPQSTATADQRPSAQARPQGPSLHPRFAPLRTTNSAWKASGTVRIHHALATLATDGRVMAAEIGELSRRDVFHVLRTALLGLGPGCENGSQALTSTTDRRDFVHV